MLLIIGAGGAIGQELCRNIHRTDALAIDRQFTNEPKIASQIVDLGKRTDLTNLSDQLNSKSIDVMYLAGRVNVASNADEIDEIYQCNVVHLARFLDCLGSRINKFQWISSISVYGTSPSSNPIRESDALQPESHYALSKRAGELVVLERAKFFGFQYQIVRLAQVFGVATAEKTLPHQLLSHLVHHKPFTFNGHPQCERDYIHVSDAARHLTALFDFNDSGVFNLGGGEPIVLSQLVQWGHEFCKVTYNPIVNASAKANSQVLDSTKAFSLINQKPEMKIQHWLAHNIEEKNLRGY